MHPAIDHAVSQAGQIILGKERQIRLAFACLLARGHLLIEDIPGVGKTTLAHVLAQILGLDFQRIQFTSDLLPADVLGVSVYDAISLILAEKRMRLKGRIVPFKWIRVTNDLICVALGAAFGKLPGIGTIITAFFMGPMITFFNTKVAEPFLYGKAGKKLATSAGRG